jgi:hypothetical protein
MKNTDNSFWIGMGDDNGAGGGVKQEYVDVQ